MSSQTGPISEGTGLMLRGGPPQLLTLTTASHKSLKTVCRCLFDKVTKDHHREDRGHAFLRPEGREVDGLEIPGRGVSFRCLTRACRLLLVL